MTLTGWLLTAVAAWVIYLHGLDLSQSGGLRVLVAHPLLVLRFALVLLSNPFIGDVPLTGRFTIACIAGPLIIALTSLGLIAVIRERGWQYAAPLLSLSLIGLIPWVVLSTGRLRHDSYIYEMSRYTTPIIPIVLAGLLALSVIQAGALCSPASTSKLSTLDRILSPKIAKYSFTLLSLLVILGYSWNLWYSIGWAKEDSERREIADKFNLFSDCLHEKIGGDVDPATPANTHFGVNLTGLHNREGMRLLAAGGYRPLIRNPVFVDDSRYAVGQIDLSDQKSDDPDAIDLSGSFQIRSQHRFSPFVLVTVRGGSKIVGAEYQPALSQPHIGYRLPWKLTVLESICTAQGQKLSLNAWVYDQTKKVFCSIGYMTLPESRQGPAPVHPENGRGSN